MSLEILEPQIKTDIATWFEECEKKLGIEVRKIPATQSKEWKITYNENGEQDHIAHHTQRFHKIVFLQSWEPLRSSWVDRCLLEPVIEGPSNIYGIILLARYKDKYLVQAKGEPGYATPHKVALTSTIQASFSNIDMALSGITPFLDLLNDPACKKLPVIQDGGQLLNKINQVCFIDLAKKPAIIPYNFYWATIDEIKELASKSLVSEHLLQALGILSLYNH